MKDANPLQNVYKQIKRLLSLTVFKDQQAASLFETDESKWNGKAYIRACLKDDNYVTYSEFWTYEMFSDVNHGVKYSEYQNYLEDPRRVPLIYQDHLQEAGREAFLSSYEEKNNYYRMLIGLPYLEDTEFIYPSAELCSLYSFPDETPVHLLTDRQQDQYMMTDEYQQVLNNNVSKPYLKYLGSKKVDLFTARGALDFDIIRYPNGDPYINKRLLSTFAQLYPEYREFVMTALYNQRLSELYVNYREFMGMLIIAFTLMQVNNSALEGINSHEFIDDSLLHTLFSMYNIPEDALMTTEMRRNLSHSLLKVVKEKGTSDVYYDLLKILGYEEVRVSKLMLMKGQQFDQNGTANGHDPYFLQIDLKDDNPYETIAKGNAPVFSYKQIIDGDPQWWDLDDVKKKLEDSEFSMSDSKYIVLDATISQSKWLFETIYFTRMILDNKSSTSNFLFEIPDLFGSEKVSVYDCVLYLLCSTCLISKLPGSLMKDSEELLATAGFNFDYDSELIDEFLESSTYIDKKKLNHYLGNLSIMTVNDIGRVYSEVLMPLHSWLEGKISASTERGEFIEYEALYRALFTYDITKNSFIEDLVIDFKRPIEVVKEKYSMSQEDIQSLLDYFEEHQEILIDLHGSTISVFDILNCYDCLELTDSNGDRIFMEWIDSNQGWVVREKIHWVEGSVVHTEDLVQLALNSVDSLDPDRLEGEESIPTTVRENFRDIIHDKLALDLEGCAEPPDSYLECLYRQNTNLYWLLFTETQEDGRTVIKPKFEVDPDGWVSDLTKVLGKLENELGIQLKNIEQSAIGLDMYFKPLISMINRFKSLMVSIAKTGVKFAFDNKFDLGGNSNMLKFFDAIHISLIFTTLAGSGYESYFALYDVQHSQKTYVTLADRSDLIRAVIGNGFLSQYRKKRMGSMNISDECILYQNGETDGWKSGDPTDGRWPSSNEALMRARDTLRTIPIPEYDLEGWMDYVESTSPVE